MSPSTLAIAQLIAAYGIPYAFEIWKILTRSNEPTAADWTDLLKLSQKPYDTYIDEARARAGLPPLPPPPV